MQPQRSPNFPLESAIVDALAPVARVVDLYVLDPPWRDTTGYEVRFYIALRPFDPGAPLAAGEALRAALDPVTWQRECEYFWFHDADRPDAAMLASGVRIFSR